MRGSGSGGGAITIDACSVAYANPYRMWHCSDQVSARENHRQTHEVRCLQYRASLNSLGAEILFENLLTSTFRSHDRVAVLQKRLERQRCFDQRMVTAHQADETV